MRVFRLAGVPMCVHVCGGFWRILDVPLPHGFSQRTSCPQRSWLQAWAMKGFCFSLMGTCNFSIH